MSPDIRAEIERASRTRGRSPGIVARVLLLTLLALAAMTGPAWGSTLSFTGAFSSDWNTPGNWTDTSNATVHAVPTAGDDAIIALGKAPVLATGVNGAARSVALDPGASLSVAGLELAVAGGAPSTFAGTVSLSSAATLRLGGATTWSAGDWSLSASTLANAGNLSITGDVTAAGTGASRIANTGTISRNDGAPAAGAAVFTAPLDNAGTFSVAAGTAELRGGGGPDTGSFTTAAGSLLALSGNHAMAAGSVLSGAGTLRLDGSTLTVPATANLFAPGTLIFSGGFLDLNKDSTAGRITSDGEGGGRHGNAAVLTGGGPTLLDNVTLETSATTLTGPGVTIHDISMNAAVLSLGDATNTLWDTGTWDLLSSRIENAGSLLITGDGTVANRVSSTVANRGTITRDDATPATGTSSFRASLLNDGDVNVVAGELQLAGASADTSGGTFRVDAPAVLSVTGAPTLSPRGDVTGTGTVRLDAGTLSAPPGAGLFDPATVVFSGGFLNLGRDATIGRLTSDGQGGGRATGIGALTAGGPTLLDNVLLFGGTTNLTGPSVTLRNLTAMGSDLNLSAATHALWDSGDWQLSDARITNAGELTVTGDGTAANAGDPPQITNTGTLIRDDADPAGAGAPFTAPLRNRGVMHVVHGALDLGTLGDQDAGSTVVDAGATLDGPGGHFAIAGGRLGGAGTVAGDLENSGGTVAPGASPGILTVDGAYSQGAGATLESEVTATTAGSGYDRLAVTGAASIAGTLDIVTPAEFLPPPNSLYDVLTASTLTGTFDTVNGEFVADRQYLQDYNDDPGRVRLSVPGDGCAPLTLDDVHSGGAVAGQLSCTGGPFTFSIGSQPAVGFADVDPSTGLVSYSSSFGFTGADDFTVLVDDGSAAREVPVSVQVVDQPPVCLDVDLGTIAPGETASGLADCSDPDADDAVADYAVATGPANGTASAEFGSLSYTPDPGFTGTDRFTYTVTDGIRTSAPATVSVTVTDGAANQPPTVSIDGPATVKRGISGSFTANAADADGAVQAYAWDVDGDGFDDGDTATLQHTFTDLGDQTLQVRVTDDRNAQTVAARTVTVENQLPTVAIDGPAQAHRGEAVALTATGEADPDGTVASRAWKVDGTAAGTGATISPAFTTLGDHGVTLTVTDDDGGTFTATATVTIVDQSPTAAIAGPATGTIGAAVPLTGTAADPDGAATIVARQWDTDGDGQFDDATGTTAAPVFTTAGAKPIRFRVTDDDGKTATATKTVTIAGPTGGGTPPPGDGGTPPGGGIGTPPGGGGGAGGPAPDTTAPRLTLAAAGAQKLATALSKGLRLRLTCDENCSVGIVISIDKQTAKRYGLGHRTTVVARISAALRSGTTTVPVKFTAKARKHLKHAKRLKLAVKVRAADADGNATTVPKSMRLK